MIKEKLLIITDDFTGACDTGVQFSKRRLRSIVLTNKDFIHRTLNDCDVMVIDTESRFDDKETAYKKTYETGKLVKAENIKYIYKKIDSTFRGNIGAEISGIMDSLEINHAIIVPALPSNYRTTKDGNVYVKGVLLADTEIANDPINPVRESYIPKIISNQTDKKTEVINYKDVLSGKQNLSDKVQQLIRNGVQMIVIDALEKEDIDLIASVITTLKEKVLYVGTAGLAEYLPKYLDIKREKKINVVIAGSVSEVTRKQVDYAKEKSNITLIDVEIGKLFSEERHQEKDRIIKIIKESSQKGDDIIIRSAPSKASVAESFENGLKYGLDRIAISETVATFLGEISKYIIQEIKINGILFTGGDIAIKATQCLNITATVIQDEILPGIPYGHFVEGQYKNIIVVTKAGGFGNEDAILQVLNFLNKS